MKHIVFHYFISISKVILHIADSALMKKILFILSPILLQALSPFESPQPNDFNLSVFNTSKNILNVKASENQKIKCRYVCDKKIYKEQEIADAISFYKNSKEYKFK